MLFLQNGKQRLFNEVEMQTGSTRNNKLCLLSVYIN